MIRPTDLFQARANSPGWFSLSPYSRSSKPADQNAKPQNYAYEDGVQLAPVLGAVLMLARAFAASTIKIEEQNSDGMWQPVTTDIPMWASPTNYRANNWQDKFEMLFGFAMNLLLGGNGYLYVNAFHNGQAEEVYALNQKQIGITWDTTTGAGSPITMMPLGSEPIYHIGDTKVHRWMGNNAGVVHTKFWPSTDLLVGLSPLALAAPPFRVGLAAEAHAELFFSTGGVGPGIIASRTDEIPEGSLEEVAEHFREVREDPFNRHMPLFLQGDLDFISTFVNPDQMQLLDARKFTIAGASAVYGVPPPFLGSPDVTTWGQGVKELLRFMNAQSLAPLLVQGSIALSQLLPQGRRASLTPDHITTESDLDQGKFFELGIRNGWLRRSEVRHWRGLPPIPGIDDEELPSSPTKKVEKDDSDEDSDQDS